MDAESQSNTVHQRLTISVNHQRLTVTGARRYWTAGQDTSEKTTFPEEVFGYNLGKEPEPQRQTVPTNLTLLPFPTQHNLTAAAAFPAMVSSDTGSSLRAALAFTPPTSQPH